MSQEWQRATDPTSGKPYYYNTRTKETSWAPPPPTAPPVYGEGSPIRPSLPIPSNTAAPAAPHQMLVQPSAPLPALPARRFAAKEPRRSCCEKTFNALSFTILLLNACLLSALFVIMRDVKDLSRPNFSPGYQAKELLSVDWPELARNVKSAHNNLKTIYQDNKGSPLTDWLGEPIQGHTLRRWLSMEW